MIYQFPKIHKSKSSPNMESLIDSSSNILKKHDLYMKKSVIKTVNGLVIVVKVNHLHKINKKSDKQ